MTDTGTVDIHSDAFARRLANLLAQRRRQRGTSLRKLARSSGRAFTAQELRAFEEGRAAIDAGRLDAVAELYGADLELILADRLPLEVRPVGVIMTGGIAQSFTPGDETSLLMSYLRLVRQLRSAEHAPAISLRREDVEVLADHLGQPGESIIDRLGALMGATVAQRRAMAGLFLSGALVIGLAGGTVAALGAGGSSSGTDATTPARDAVTTTVAVVDPSSVVVDRAGDVSDGVHALPRIVLDGESHGAPDAVPLTDTAADPVATDAPSGSDVGATGPGTGAPAEDHAAPTTLAPTPDDVIVTEDTAVTDDGSIGVAAPVVPVVDDASAGDVTDTTIVDDGTTTDADVPFDADTVVIDDTVVVDDSGADLGDDTIVVDDATPPLPADDDVELAVAPPPLP